MPVDAIHPNPRQPRRRFESEAASGLAESVRQQGVIQPLLVRPRGVGGYEIVAGERRWRAAREAGRETVPAVVRDVDDRETLLLGLVENVAREQLTPVEEARAYAVLIDEFDALARRGGRARRPLEADPSRTGSACSSCRTTCSGWSSAASSARAMRAPSSPCPTTRAAAGWRGRSCGAASRCVRPSSGRSGPARGSGPRTRSVPVDPALAERVQAALASLTGRQSRIAAGRVELPFADEHDLAELAEALEHAASRL